FRHRRAPIQRPRGRGAQNATTDAERAFGLRLPVHERELLRLSREIDAIRERHNSSWRGGSPQREHSVAHSDVLRRGRLLIGSGIKNHQDRKSTRLNSSHVAISYAVFCLKKKKENDI